MHPTMRYQLGRADVADRIERTHGRRAIPKRRQHPPPIRGRVAYAAARLARRIESESARKALA